MNTPAALYQHAADHREHEIRASLERLRSEKRGDNPYLCAVGERIREVRLRVGLGATAASKALNGSRSALSQMEHGLEDLRVSTVLRIAAVLGCQPADLLPPVEVVGR